MRLQTKPGIGEKWQKKSKTTFVTLFIRIIRKSTFQMNPESG
jgi:hypothetical protein